MDEIRVKKPIQQEFAKPEVAKEKIPIPYSRPKRKFPKKLFLGIILVAFLATAGFYLSNYFNKGEVDAVKEVSKIYLLPENENPTVATVKDVSQLRDKKFFINALEGDKVVIYEKADLVILYRPKEGRIINVAGLVDSKIDLP